MKVIQISDMHLFANDDLDIYGVKSNITFKNVMIKILDEDIQDTDMIFLTGDTSQDETPESYQKVVNHLSNLNIPVYWIPGNHDNTKQLESIFQSAKNFNRTASLILKNWNLIFLNTKIEGAEDGYLSPTELKMLKDKIASSPSEKKIAIVMHHHPAPVGTPLIDSYILRNASNFWDIVTGTKVELVICGHVHGDYQFKYNNIMIESSPATCLQWLKGTKDLRIDNKIGYKIYHFELDGYRASSKIW